MAVHWIQLTLYYHYHYQYRYMSEPQQLQRFDASFLNHLIPDKATMYDLLSHYCGYILPDINSRCVSKTYLDKAKNGRSLVSPLQEIPSNETT